MKLFNSASALAVGPLSRQLANALGNTPGARSLTIGELNGLLATETKKEFEWSADSPEQSAILWKSAVAHEWELAARGEEFHGNKYPYVLCHTGDSMSGYKRKLEIIDAVNTTEELHLRTIYNSDDYYCVYGQMFASVAAAITGDEFIVQPVIPSLKYMEHSVDAIQGIKEGADMTIEANLCPGVAMASDNYTLYNDMEALADAIIAKLVPTTLAEKLADAISDAYYLTSEEYLNSTDSLGNMTERAQLWKELLNDYQESGICDEVYKSRLDWSLDRATDAETGNSQVTVKFNNTGNSTQDQGCIMTLTFAIASHPAVCSLDLKREVGVQNTIPQWMAQSELEGKVPFFDSGLDGTGQIVAVSDTGIDLDNCYFIDDAEEAGVFGINDRARKVVQYVPYVDNGDYRYGHGTHVAGSIAGKRIDSIGAADGVAPNAKLAFYDIGDSAGALYLPPDSLLLDIGRPESHIHSMSWGAEFNFYTTQSRNFDQYMYENDDFLILVAAGNSGAGDAMNTVGSPATAKNVLAVGSHHSWGSSLPMGKLGPAYVSDFSSRGPTSDGRMKPNIVAVGHSVLSAGALPDQVGECDPGNGRIPGANSYKEGLLSLQGTSMATPLTAGHASLVRQYFEEGYYPTGVKGEGRSLTSPSGTLIKAILMNGAQPMKGVDNGVKGVTPVELYDFNQGFGHLSLQNSIYLPGKTNVQLQAWDRETVIDGGSQTYEVRIDKNNGCTHQDLAVTLVWSEEASSPGCIHCLLHDLDLTVAHGGTTYYPNCPAGSVCQPDRRNNAERVIVSGVQNGDVATITVTAHNLARYEQQYSLVATGCFGGVANELYANGECSVFECDNSKSKRRAIILSVIFVPLAVILIAIIGKKMKGKSQARECYEETKTKHEVDHSESKGNIEEGVSVIDTDRRNESKTNGHGHSGIEHSNRHGRSHGSRGGSALGESNGDGSHRHHAQDL